MTVSWPDLLSLIRDFPSRKFIVAVCACLALVLATAGPLRAQITGTAGFETGLQALVRNLTLDHVPHLADANPFGAEVNWGDLTPFSPGLLKCAGPLNFDTCDVFGTHMYSLPGTYTITISYDEPRLIGNGPRHTVNTTATISPPGPFVILTIGDSVASGEGNPDENINRVNAVNEAYWDDPVSDYDPTANDGVCHRSSSAGFVLAQHDIQNLNPAITTVTVACSGNSVQQTMDSLRAARAVLPRIDVLLISVGANNVDGGFGNLVQQCITVPLTTPCSADTTFTGKVSDSINNLGNCTVTTDANCYPHLAKEINCIDADTGMKEPSCSNPAMQIPKLVLITEYFDPTHDNNGMFPTKLLDPGCVDGVLAVSVDDWSYLYNSVVLPLNQQVRSFPSLASAAGLVVPTYAVTGIQDDFLFHGYCAGGQRWVNNGADTLLFQGDAKGASHPNAPGQQEYRTKIETALLLYNPPVTTASATAGGTPYTFGTWATQNVTVTLSATNAIKEAGVGFSFYGLDSVTCAPTKPEFCQTYAGPFTIATSGKHVVTFFSSNASTNLEAPGQSVQVWVDKNPPLSSVPDTMIILQGASASYTITLGHQGWAGQTINLSCTTDADLSQCTMLPTSVTLDATASNASVATVVTTLGRGLILPTPGNPPDRFDPLGTFRFLLALTMAALLAAMARAVRAKRWAPLTHFAALALLFGLLCAGCNSAAQIPGTSRGLHTVTITGTDGVTTNTVQAKLIVQ